MSYSLSVKAATKAEARAAIAAKFEADVVAHQPIHERDRAAMLANVDQALAQLDDNPALDVSLSVGGYLAWTASDSAGTQVTAVGISCNAGHATRE